MILILKKHYQLLVAVVFISIFGIATPAWANLHGRVIAVLDGDTIDVLVDGQSVRIRFAEIDAPEKRQAFGGRSKQVLADLVFKKFVTVVENKKDRYGRVLGTVYASGENINAKMVQQGMAWVYRQYAKDTSLYTLEAEARNAQRGLWADPNPIPPWEFRKKNKTAFQSPTLPEG